MAKKIKLKFLVKAYKESTYIKKYVMKEYDETSTIKMILKDLYKQFSNIKGLKLILIHRDIMI